MALATGFASPRYATAAVRTSALAAELCDLISAARSSSYQGFNVKSTGRWPVVSNRAFVLGIAAISAGRMIGSHADELEVEPPPRPSDFVYLVTSWSPTSSDRR